MPCGSCRPEMPPSGDIDHLHRIVAERRHEKAAAPRIEKHVVNPTLHVRQGNGVSPSAGAYSIGRKLERESQEEAIA